MEPNTRDAWPAGGPAPDPSRPLSGLRVVSMAEQYPGPYCTLVLSDLGADVIQVERPGRGDPSRGLPPLFALLNRNKRSVALDLADPADLAKAQALIAASDVFLEGFRPGKLANKGLGWADLSAANPGLIYCAISGFGQTGPLRDRPAHDLGFQGLGGALDERICGAVSGAPPSMLLGDGLSALYAAVGILAALRRRDQTGEGAFVDIAMADAAAAAVAPLAAIAGAEGPQPAPPQAEPAYDLFRCADDRWLTLSIAHEDDQWRRLAALLAFEPEIAALPRPARTARRAELRDRLAATLAQKPRAHWAAQFDAADLMWTPANRWAELADDPQLQARGLFERAADGAWALRPPVKISDAAPPPLAPAPRLGADQSDLDEL